MPKGPFREFIQTLAGQDTLRKFVDHAVDDPNLDSLESWEDLEEYLKSKAANGSVFEQAKYVWNMFEKHPRQTVTE